MVRLRRWRLRRRRRALRGLRSAAAAPLAANLKAGVFWRQDAELIGFSAFHYVRSGDAQRKKSDAVLLQHPGVSGSSAGGGSLAMLLSGSSSLNAGGVGGGGHGGHGGGGAAPPKPPPRYTVMCDGVEWVVAQGEHNAWEAIVLLLFQRAKRGGFLGGLDVRTEVFSLFRQAITTEGAALLDMRQQNTVTAHGLLTILHPWSQALEDVSLDVITAKLES